MKLSFACVNLIFCSALIDIGAIKMIYEKTQQGVEAFHQKPSPLNPKLRSILIMIDGKKSSSDLLAVLAAIGGTEEHLAELISLGLIRAVQEQTTSSARVTPKIVSTSNTTSEMSSAAGLTDQQRYEKAYPIATKLTSGLGLRGFRLNLSVEGAGNIHDLMALASKIKEAVGDAKYAELQPYLQG
jgi:hypothetical protein